ncbi:uncharacterized protein LOC141858680 [Brevipalpus obovatus]|uniref:uncharacterized protein LOC141858680 n=1 Tax=Brevipalpus obovatus TaxID=246614 RepID=UPI003D9EB626
MPSLKEFVHQNTIQLDKRKQKIKHLIDTLNGLTLDHCAIPLPLTILNKLEQDSDELVDDVHREKSNHQNNEKTSNPAAKGKKINIDTPSVRGNFLQDLGHHEKNRRKLAEERRKEYNEYLREKSKLASMRGRNLKVFEKEPQIKKQPQYRSYGEILDEKRREEKLYRTLNDHHMSIDTEAARNMIKNQLESNVGEIFDWQVNIAAEDIVEPVVPRAKLLNTYSSRQKAAKYRDELLKQMEEKQTRDKEAKKRDRTEELMLEKRIQEQRIKMMRDYEEEQKRLRLKAKQELMARRQESAQSLESDEQDLSSESAISSARTPSYRCIRSPKSPKNRKIKGSIDIERGTKAKNDRPRITLAIDPGVPKPRYNSPNSERTRRDSKSPEQQPQAIQREAKPMLPSDQELLGGGRVLTQLAEIRKKILDEHREMIIKMSQSSPRYQQYE